MSQQIPLQLQFPAEVHQIAATHQLGIPTVEYKASTQAISRYLIRCALGVIGIGFIACGYLGDLFILVGLLFVAIGSIWLVSGVWWIVNILLSYNSRVYVCNNGLIRLKGRKTAVIYWDQVGEVWHKRFTSSTQILSWLIGFFALFGLLGILLGRLYYALFYAQWTFPRMVDVYKVRRTDGVLFLFKDTLDNIEGLGTTIEREVMRRHLPQAIAAYESGFPVSFGKLVVHSRGISVGRGSKTLLWDEFESIQIDEKTGKFSIRKKGKRVAWFSIPRFKVSNASVFLDLVNYVHRGVTTHDLPQAGATQLSQALATYKTGSPMVFGKLTVSQQGVYDGQEMLPWDQIKSVQINDDRMTIIKKKGNDLAWSIYQVSQVQRASLFMDLVNSISKGQM